MYSEDFINETIKNILLEFYDVDNTAETRLQIEDRLNNDKTLDSLYFFHVIAGNDLNTEEDAQRRRINLLVNYKINSMSDWNELTFTLNCYPWAKHLSQIVEEEEKFAAASVTYSKLLKNKEK